MGRTRIALYKGQHVAVKDINKSSVDMKNKFVKKELRLVRRFLILKVVLLFFKSLTIVKKDFSKFRFGELSFHVYCKQSCLPMLASIA